jgi:putative addiction module component (TIGR02574 family)
MLIDEIAPEALKLPPRERALLAASLWESIGDPNDLAADLDDEEAINLALTRDAEIESGQVKAMSHTDLMNRLRG